MAWKDAAKRRAWFKERYKHNVEWVKKYKLDIGCTDCGYKAHYAALEFDHLPHLGGRKRGTVANQMGKSLGVIKEEIERCEVVCATCHAIRTHNRQ